MTPQEKDNINNSITEFPENNVFTKSRRIRPWVFIALLLINVLVFVFIGTVYFRYVKSADEKLYNENISTVESLNEASANAAYTYTRSMGIKIDDTANYIETNGLDYERTVDYLGDSNTNTDRQFQLVLSGTFASSGKISFGDYSGVSIRKVKQDDGTVKTVKNDIIYGSGYYEIYESFTDVDDENLNGLCFAPEFTDPDTKEKCFGVYRHVILNDAEGEEKLYTVLLAINSQTALNAYNMQNEYEGQSTVLIDESGDYIIRNDDFRNANFFDYIVNYNDLTINDKADLQATLTKTIKDEERTVDLFYKNHNGSDCVFATTVMENGWYSVTCVPIAAFDLENAGTNYSLIILILFLLLFVTDGVAIYFGAKNLNANMMIAERAQNEATEANKAKSRFLSTMSHELRTPLNAIIGLTALSRDSIKNPPVLDDYLKKIDSSSKLLLQLISDILDISAIESSKMKLNISEFDLTKLVSLLSAIYYDQSAAKDIEFNVKLKNIRSERLIGDPVRVNQVLLNFLSNAVKYTPCGGKVTLGVEKVRCAEGYIVFRFEVDDTGCGINDELRARLFKPFERANGEVAQKTGGTGLGLSIAKSLVELMDGSIGVESTEGVGSCFWAEIPFKLSPKAVRHSFIPIKNLRVLAAVNYDDEREYFRQMLKSFGVEYILADSVASATELLLENSDARTPVDLCLLDWKLPDLNAMDATVKIKKELGTEGPRIVVLAYDISEAKPKCLKAGADDILGKPVFPSQLYNFLEEMTTGVTRVIPEMTQKYDMSGKRVLLVEDNEMNLIIAQQLLSKVGLNVEIEKDGKLGYERFAASAPGYFDAILMDVQMPVMNGYQATRAIRGDAHPQAKTIPILAMTADAFSEDVNAAIDAGMNEHLSKPIEPENLYAALNKYLFRA